jgi:hypothetical protein
MPARHIMRMLPLSVWQPPVVAAAFAVWALQHHISLR